MSFHNTSRIDCAEKRMYGYIAQVTIDGQTFRRFCSDRRHGGGDAARNAAARAVAEMSEERRLYLQLKRRHRRRTNSPGDVPGVNRSPSQIEDDCGYWIARWHDESGHRRAQKFPVKRFGELGAYELALETRLRATEHERSALRIVQAHLADFTL